MEEMDEMDEKIEEMENDTYKYLLIDESKEEIIKKKNGNKRLKVEKKWTKTKLENCKKLFVDACKNGNIKVLKLYYLKSFKLFSNDHWIKYRGCSIIDILQYKSYTTTSFWYACCNNNIEIISLFINELGEYLNELLNVFCKHPYECLADIKSPLAVACKNGHLNVIKMLCDHLLLTSSNIYNENCFQYYLTPEIPKISSILHVAILYYQDDIVEYLCKNLSLTIDINFIDSEYGTPLHTIFCYKNANENNQLISLKMLNLLLSNPRINVNIACTTRSYRYQILPISLAILSSVSKSKLFKILLNDERIDLNRIDERNYHLFHYSLFNSKNLILLLRFWLNQQQQLLLSSSFIIEDHRNININCSCNNENYTITLLICENAGRVYTLTNMHYILENFLVKSMKVNFNQLTTTGMTPLHLYYRKYLSVDYRIPSSKFEKILCARGDVNFNLKERQSDWTIIHYICKFGYLEMLDYILKNANNICNAKDSEYFINNNNGQEERRIVKESTLIIFD